MSIVTTTVGVIAVRTVSYYGPTTAYKAIGTVHDDRVDAQAVVNDNTYDHTYLGHNQYGNSVDVHEAVTEVNPGDIWDTVDGYTDLNDVVLPERYAEAVAAGRTEAADADRWVQGNAEAMQGCIDAALADKRLALVADDNGDLHIVRVG